MCGVGVAAGEPSWTQDAGREEEEEEEATAQEFDHPIRGNLFIGDS
jgi:hypothetical protein